MRSLQVGLLVCLAVGAPVWSQQTSQSESAATAPGITFLRQASGALVGSIDLSDVTLLGTARRIAGSDDETGTVTMRALATGQSQLIFSFPSGPRSEVVSVSSTGAPTGSWTGPDGIVRAIAEHNLWTDSSWFFPALTVSKLLSSQDTTVTLLDLESKGGVNCVHLTAAQIIADAPADFIAEARHLSQMDLYLDAMTLLPVALQFNEHPDNNALIDIPVEVQLSDYRSVNGVAVPFHIEQFLNNSLHFDIRVQSATLNSGLTPSSFILQ